MLFRSTLLLSVLSLPLLAAEQDALRISDYIQYRHMPFNTVLDPIFTTPESEDIEGFSRCGDSALWTGHYLAAEAYRYKVTGDPAALNNAWRALSGLRLLVYVTGNNVLARCAFPVQSQYAEGIISEERHHGVHFGNYDQTGYLWVGNTSRDQYSGVFFGLMAAWELINDPGMNSTIADLVWRMVDNLDQHDWKVVMPDGVVSTAYTLRPDQHLTILQIARQVLPWRFGSDYSSFATWHFFQVSGPIIYDLQDPYNSYFKFNLNSINMFNLLRFENNGTRRSFYSGAYNSLRSSLRTHQNAFFNMLDRALSGPEPYRDQETAGLLEAWLQRSRRDPYIDRTNEVAVCGDHACVPIPVERRISTDFLWQRSPFQLAGGGGGRIENAGIDYILPYWMARYYRVISN